MHFTDEKKRTEDAERNKEAFIVNTVHNKGYLYLNKKRQLCTATKLNHKVQRRIRIILTFYNKINDQRY